MTQNIKTDIKKHTQKNITIEHSTRQQIAEFLPEAISLAVASYRTHMGTPIDAKGFESHHKQAKVAISHIELLIKLAKWADLPDKEIVGDTEANYLQGLMTKAEAEINAYEEDE